MYILEIGKCKQKRQAVMARKDSILSSVTRQSSRVSTPVADARHKFDLMVLEQVNNLP